MVEIRGEIMSDAYTMIDLLNDEMKELIENIPQVKQLRVENEKQKTEIERLTEELDLANETIDRNNKRYERVSIERQKALDMVDCLEDALLDKIRRNEELITAIKQTEQQAVKDTAKEILTKMLTNAKRLKEQFNSITYGKNREHLIATIEIEIEGIKNLAKRYGVEVE